VFTVFCIVCTVFLVLFSLCIFILICFVLTLVNNNNDNTRVSEMKTLNMFYLVIC